MFQEVGCSHPQNNDHYYEGRPHKQEVDSGYQFAHDVIREVVEAGAAQAYQACTPTAVLLSQRLIGAKVFVK